MPTVMKVVLGMGLVLALAGTATAQGYILAAGNDGYIYSVNTTTWTSAVWHDFSGVAVVSVERGPSGQFYAITADRKLWELNANGTSKTELVSDTTVPTGNYHNLTVRPGTGEIYWSNAYSSAGVYKCNSDGSGTTQVNTSTGLFGMLVRDNGNFFSCVSANAVREYAENGTLVNSGWSADGYDIERGPDPSVLYLQGNTTFNYWPEDDLASYTRVTHGSWASHPEQIAFDKDGMQVASGLVGGNAHFYEFTGGVYVDRMTLSGVTVHDLTNGTPAAVPEPATLSLLALGGLGALVTRRRRQ